MGAPAQLDPVLPLLGAQAIPTPEGRTRKYRCCSDKPWTEISCSVLALVFLCSVGLVTVRAVADLIDRAKTTGVLEYSAAITGVDGLDGLRLPPTSSPTLLSPVFSLTVHVKEFDEFISEACVGSRSTVITVSYHDLFLAKGRVPRLCVGRMQEGGVDITAWGVDVAVPAFMRERLAAELERGEAVFDVAVMDPPYEGDNQLVCKAKVGEGLCPCKFEY